MPLNPRTGLPRFVHLLLVGSLALFLGSGPSEVTGKIEAPVLSASAEGHPWINLSDGHLVPARYLASPDLIARLESSQPTTVTTGDFNADGLEDLVAGFKDDLGGLVTIHYANPGFRFAKPGEEKAPGIPWGSPFLEEVDVLQTPLPAEMLAAGDFNADARTDLIVARRRDNRLAVINGTDRTGFDDATLVPLPGIVTSLASGEVNRADGHSDLAVAVESDGSASLLLYEGPAGAFSRDPEVLSLPHAASGIAIDQFGGGYPYDVAVAAGDEIVFFQGRDTGLERTRTPSGDRSVVRRTVVLPEKADHLVTGDFLAGKNRDVAVVMESGRLVIVDGGSGTVVPTSYEFDAGSISGLHSARLSSQGKDDLLLVNRADKKLTILHDGHFALLQHEVPGLEGDAGISALAPVELTLSGTPAGTSPMMLNGDGAADIAVLMTAAGGNGVATAVSMPLQDIWVTEAGFAALLPSAGETCITQDGGCSFNAAVQLANKEPGADRIRFSINEASPSWDITSQITVDGSDVGRVYLPNASQYLQGLTFATGSESSVVKNLAVERGIDFESEGGGNRIENCYIGTGPDGMPVAGKTANSGFGLRVEGPGNAVGGGADFANVLSQLTVDGAGNEISGNLIGLAVDGETPLRGGISVYGSNNTIGGTATGEANVMPALTLSGRGTVVVGNLIGLTSDGTRSAGNTSDGINVSERGQTIGGSGTGMGNTISGHGRNGIYIQEDSVRVLGNRIGTDLLGREAVPNAEDGIEIRVSDATEIHIGGADWGAGNTISGNGGYGINTPSENVQIAGNYIGVDISGTSALPNMDDGIYAWGSGIVIGGQDLAAANVIGSNEGDGIHVDGDSADILNNFIGTDRSGTVELGNKEHGIHVSGWSSDAWHVKIGGTDPDEANSIAFNERDGIHLSQDNSDRAPAEILGNRIWSNGRLGINIESSRENEDGVNENDEGDDDSGPNKRQNYPDLTVKPDGSLQVDLDSEPDKKYRVEFFGNPECDPSGHGEGNIFLEAIDMTTDASGSASETRNFTVYVGQEHITATATDPDGNTSELSACAVVDALQPLRLKVVQKDESGDLVPVPDTPFDLGTFEPDNPDGPIRISESEFTDAGGFINLTNPAFQEGEQILVRSLAHTEPAAKGGHEAVGNTSYQIYVDNLIVLPDGTVEAPKLLPNEENVAETILTHTEIVYNLVVSIEWKAGATYVQNLAEAFRQGSDYLLDVTNGQAYFGKVAIYDNRTNWSNADIQILANNTHRGHAPLYALGQAGATGGENVYIRVAPRNFGSPDLTRNSLPDEIPLQPQHPDNHRTLVHEWGHYAFGFQDEYMDALGRSIGILVVYGFMDTYFPESPGSPSYMKSEMSENEDALYRQTAQFASNGKTCWEQFKADFDGKRFGSLVTNILAPSNAGVTDYVRGPNEAGQSLTYPVGRHMEMVTSSTDPSAPGVVLQAVVELPDPGTPSSMRALPVADAAAILDNGDRLLNLGKTADDGRIQILGADPGNEVRFEADVYAAVGAFVPRATRLLTGTKEITSGMPNPTQVVLGQIQSESQLITKAKATGPTTADLIALGASLFGAPLKMEMQPDGGERTALTVIEEAEGYRATIDDLHAGETVVFFSTVDDNETPFTYTNRLSVLDVPTVEISLKTTEPASADKVHFSTADDFQLEIDRLASTAERVIVTATDWSPPDVGLADSLRRVSKVFSVASYPEDAVLTAGMSVPYDAPAKIAEVEEGYALYEWKEETGWEEVDAGVDVVSQRLSAAVDASGVYAVYNDIRVTGTANESGEEVSPREVETVLGAPYPNPFRATTVVPFRLREAASVELILVDMLGRTVRKVASGRHASGRHEARLDAHNLPPGVYFLHLRAGLDTGVRRVVVVR